MIKGGMGFTVVNVLLALFGAVFISIFVAFIPVFVISLIVYNAKKNKKKK